MHCVREGNPCGCLLLTALSWCHQCSPSVPQLRSSMWPSSSAIAARLHYSSKDVVLMKPLELIRPPVRKANGMMSHALGATHGFLCSGATLDDDPGVSSMAPSVYVTIPTNAASSIA